MYYAIYLRIRHDFYFVSIWYECCIYSIYIHKILVDTFFSPTFVSMTSLTRVLQALKPWSLGVTLNSVCWWVHFTSYKEQYLVQGVPISLPIRLIQVGLEKLLMIIWQYKGKKWVMYVQSKGFLKIFEYLKRAL